MGTLKKINVTVFGGNQKTRDIQFEQNLIRIGRNPDNDIVLENVAVSANHAKIDLTAMTITDLSSTNGTFLGDEKIVSAPLSFGQPITIGKFRILVSEDVATDFHGDKATAILKQPQLRNGVESNVVEPVIRKSTLKEEYQYKIKGQASASSPNSSSNKSLWERYMQLSQLARGAIFFTVVMVIGFIVNGGTNTGVKSIDEKTRFRGNTPPTCSYYYSSLVNNSSDRGLSDVPIVSRPEYKATRDAEARGECIDDQK